MNCHKFVAAPLADGPCRGGGRGEGEATRPPGRLARDREDLPCGRRGRQGQAGRRRDAATPRVGARPQPPGLRLLRPPLPRDRRHRLRDLPRSGGRDAPRAPVLRPLDGLVRQLPPADERDGPARTASPPPRRRTARPATTRNGAMANTPRWTSIEEREALRAAACALPAPAAPSAGHEAHAHASPGADVGAHAEPHEAGHASQGDPSGAPDEPGRWSRRTFLTATGFSMAGALAACGRPSVRRAAPGAAQPEEVVQGRSTWYATTCGGCPAGCGLLVKARRRSPDQGRGEPGPPDLEGRRLRGGSGAGPGPLRQQAPLPPARSTAPRRRGPSTDARVVAELERVRKERGRRPRPHRHGRRARRPRRAIDALPRGPSPTGGTWSPTRSRPPRSSTPTRRPTGRASSRGTASSAPR